MSILRSNNQNCYHHYELKSYEKLFNCDGCKRRGYGQRYHCNPCGLELHKECTKPKSTIYHHFFKGSTFKFLYQPFTKHGTKVFSKCCDACGKDICGFSYRCEEIDKDLHPCCVNLKSNLHIDDMVFDLREKVLSKCIRCKKTNITDGDRYVKGWSYVSNCGKYHFHVCCMVELVHEACMKYGEVGLQNVELHKLARSSKSRGGRDENTFKMIKSVVKIVLPALFGDPTMLISNVLVELVLHGL